MRTIRDCNVCVVGGAGFLGSHLVEHLVKDRGCRVLVVDNLVAGRREWIDGIAEFAHHDITGSEDHFRNLLLRHGSKYVFNYAARPYVPDSYDRPLRTFDVNCMGAMKVINAAQEAGCEGILQVSSAELYGAGQAPNPDGYMHDRLDEDSPVEPHSTYGAAKAAVDAWVQVRWREAKTPCIALRQFNCVGERETHPYIVPEIIIQLNRFRQEWEGLQPDPLPTATVRLGNNSFRDFLYAGDAVRIAVELLERGQFGEVFNLGSETGVKMYELAKTVGKVMGFADIKIEHDITRDRKYEIWHLQSANDKVYSTIGYRPKFLGLEEAIRGTITWYRSSNCQWPWETGFGRK